GAAGPTLPTCPGENINLALNRPYVLSHSPSNGYPDNGNSQLTNGIIREQIYHNTEASVGWQYINPFTITIDLGSVMAVNKVKIYLGGGGDGGINMPQQIDVSVSTDGSSYSTVTSKTGMPNVEQWVVIDMPSSAARYVRLQVHNNLEWTMIGEVEVYCGG
ncbi:MAG: discoidin domain-containing protein, partial [Candidatus Micrarchaeia archaeon]